MKQKGVKTAGCFGFLFFLWISSADAENKFPVFVSIVPQKYFVKEIGGDYVRVSVMVTPGANPATYEPRPKQMITLSKAKLYFAIGVPFEKAWLRKLAATHPKIRIIHTDQGIQKIPMESHLHREINKKGHTQSEDGYGGGHTDGIKDPHIWLSPSLVKIQADHILEALLSADPVHRPVYEANFKKFIAVLDKLDKNLKALFQKKTGHAFLVFHPAWGYFAHRYGLKQLAVEMEGKGPKPAQLKELIKYARSNDIQAVFVQPQFSTKSAKIIANAIGGQMVYADPLAMDWLDNLREVAEKFESALR